MSSSRKPPVVRGSGTSVSDRRTRATSRSRSTSPASTRDRQLKQQQLPKPTWDDIIQSSGYDPLATLQRRLDAQEVEMANRFKLQNDQLIHFNSRLEALLQENETLRQELKDAHGEIEELKKQDAALTAQQQQQASKPTPPKTTTTASDPDSMQVEGSLLGQGPDGTHASKYAHDFVPPKPTTFAQVAKSKLKGPPIPSRSKSRTRSTAGKKSNDTPISAATIEWAKRGFKDSKDEPTGYTFVYLKNQKRTKHSEVRRRLRIIGVPQARVVDIQFPSKGVVGLLIHSSFESILVELLTKAEIAIINNFDPTAETVINDPALEDLPDSEKKIHATEVYQQRMLRMCLHLPQAHLGHSILKFFHTQSGPHHISKTNLDIFTKRKPAPKIQRKPRNEDDEELFVKVTPPQHKNQENQDNDDQPMEV
ncbi:hypothetical protein O0I10_012990 [Lichtheimia ornata]|uniref:Uncharacterized protein n=1 Tax=Lichtheimia ornata TaxID=688661 RepID=A0AAD7XVB4_9FUNG|nr:uncharacterized protein O0I10_012990 [Lichtheimia ornata]KAJ8651457.1 hypothetical protein O0I10_012990 [Lichtheimia ornata]